MPLCNEMEMFLFSHLHNKILRVGITKPCRLQYEMVRDITPEVKIAPRPVMPRPSEPLQINLFREKSTFYVWKLGLDDSRRIWNDPLLTWLQLIY